MKADLMLIHEASGAWRLTRPRDPFWDDDADFLVYCLMNDEFHIRRYGIKIKGESNPYKAFRIIEKVAAEDPSALQVEMVNVSLKGYGR
jgi:hypothetical protein